MPSNVEIKARVNALEELKSIAQHLSQESGTTLEQEDIFFHVPEGRLKLRNIKGQKSQLVSYKRKDQAGPKLSDYSVTLIDDSESLESTLSRVLEVIGKVKKTRQLYMVGQTRIHVDEVDELGNFMELEVQMKEGQTVEEGQQIAENLMKQLGVEKEDLITCAYMDLILQKRKGCGEM